MIEKSRQTKDWEFYINKLWVKPRHPHRNFTYDDGLRLLNSMERRISSGMGGGVGRCDPTGWKPFSSAV